MFVSCNALEAHVGRPPGGFAIARGSAVWESPERFPSTRCPRSVVPGWVAYAAISLEQSRKGDDEPIYGGGHVLLRVTLIAALPAFPIIAVLIATGRMGQGGAESLSDGFQNSRNTSAFRPWRVVIAVVCALVTSAGCSSRLVGGAPVSSSTLAPATSAAQEHSITGIGATRADWDATHTPNPAFNNEMVYGQDPTLPWYLAANAAVYIEVSDLGTDRIQTYWVNMRLAGRDQALARVQRELPADAKVAWNLSFNHCIRIAFASPTLEAAGHYMAEVQLEDLKANGTMATRPHTFNQAKFQLDPTGSPPNPQIDCRHQIRESTLDLHIETLRPAGRQ
jgi:hypothetical protein